MLLAGDKLAAQCVPPAGFEPAIIGLKSAALTAAPRRSRLARVDLNHLPPAYQADALTR
jgi:hypothetical protein